jgi:hypothetical protein
LTILIPSIVFLCSNLWTNKIIYWTPFGVGLFILGLILFPKIRMLKDSGAKGLYIIAIATVIAPAMALQQYVRKESYELLNVQTVNEIPVANPKQFYKIESYSVNKNQFKYTSDSYTIGRRKLDRILYFNIYVVSPFVINISDSTKDLTYWYAILYSMSMSDNASQSDKDGRYKAFLNQSIYDFQYRHSTKSDYFEVVQDDKYLEAIYKFPNSENNGYSVILTPRHEPFPKIKGNNLIWVYGSYIIGLLIFLIWLLAIIGLGKK